MVWIFKSSKWLNIAGFVKRRLVPVHVMRTKWVTITTNKKKGTIRMASTLGHRFTSMPVNQFHHIMILYPASNK